VEDTRAGGALRRQSSDRTRLRTFAVGLPVLAFVFFFGLRGVDLWNDYVHTLSESEGRADNLALILTDHMQRTVDAVDAGLLQLVRHSERIGGPAASREEWLPMLESVRAGMNGVGSLTVTDAEGIIVHTTTAAERGESRRDTFLFRTLAGDATAGVVADAPFKAINTGRMVIPVGRRLEVNGSFAGMVVATLAPEELRGFYKAVNVGAGGFIWVFHPGGHLIFREPSPTDLIGIRIDENPIFRAQARGDRAGVVYAPLQSGAPYHISAFRTIDRPPLSIAVSLSEAEVFAGFRKQVLQSAGVAAVIALVLFVATRTLVRQIDQRAAVEDALSSRERELREAQRIAKSGSARFIVPDFRVALSQEAAELLGTEGPRTIALTDLEELVQTPDQPGLRDALQRCVYTKARFEIELRLRRGAPERAVLAAGVWEDDTGILAVFQDITDRKNLDEMLRQSQRLEAIGRFTGGVAHDFNNLLSVIIGNLELLRAEVRASPPLTEYLPPIERAAERGADLTRRLLAFARRQPLRPRPFDVNELVASAQPLLSRLVGAGIELRLKLGQGRAIVNTDASQVELALVNLCVNARDAMPSSGLIVIETGHATLDSDYVRSHADVTPGDYVCITVSDTGPGIAPEHLPLVFEPFFTTKEPGKGTGLGLSMIYGFTKQSGGHAKIYSELGHGTTVKLYFPRAPANTAAETDDPKLVRGAGETILVVEDDDQVRTLVERMIASLGYRATAVKDGAAALAAVDRQPFDLLFTDVVLTGFLNGRELAEAIKARRPDIGVLFTSGYPEDVVSHQGRLDPGVRLVSKPYRKEELSHHLRTALERSAELRAG
jgi:signal transduction histidine kinase